MEFTRNPNFTAYDLIEEAARLAEQRPGGMGCRKYGTKNFNGPYAPHCLFGHAISNLDPEMFQEVCQNANGTNIVNVILEWDNEGWLDRYSPPSRGRIKMWLDQVQSLIDNNVSWGNAIGNVEQSPNTKMLSRIKSRKRKPANQRQPNEIATM